MPLVVQLNLHTLVILSSTEEFHTIFRLRQKELEKKLNRPAKLSNEFESIFVKRLRRFWRWRIKKTVCLLCFQNIWPHQSNSPTKTWGRERRKIFWRPRLRWSVKDVSAYLPWSQFLTLVIQGFKTLVVKELFSPHNLIFPCFQWCFHWWRRRHCLNWIVFPGAVSKTELGFNTIQY